MTVGNGVGSIVGVGANVGEGVKVSVGVAVGKVLPVAVGSSDGDDDGIGLVALGVRLGTADPEGVGVAGVAREQPTSDTSNSTYDRRKEGLIVFTALKSAGAGTSFILRDPTLGE